MDELTESVLVAYAIEQSAHGQAGFSNELRKQGVFISPSSIRSVWLRIQLVCFRDRLRALEKTTAKENMILTESQVQALAKNKDDNLVSGEIETAHSGSA